VQRDDRNVVFVVEGERARTRVVKPGQPFGDLTLVEGLETGARVVRAPVQDMNDGARIREGSE
jgi:hypothetical protein